VRTKPACPTARQKTPAGGKKVLDYWYDGSIMRIPFIGRQNALRKNANSAICSAFWVLRALSKTPAGGLL